MLEENVINELVLVYIDDQRRWLSENRVRIGRTEFDCEHVREIGPTTSRDSSAAGSRDILDSEVSHSSELRHS